MNLHRKGGLIVSVLLCVVLLAVGHKRESEKARNELKRLKIKYDERSFLEAALDGNTPVVALFLKAGMNPNLRDSHGATPLLVTAAGGRSETARLLLANGADIHAKDNRGWTPLIFAVFNGDLDLVKVMFNHGADVSARGQGGFTPLMVAAVRYRTQV